MKRFAIKLSVFLLILIAVLVGSDVLLRKLANMPQKWYEDAERVVVAHPVDYLFVGSSRVAAAIDVQTFSSIMSKQLGKPVHALNLGQGFSTPIEHYIGLRRLFQVAPDHLNGCVVFWEAPGQVADLGAWDGPWVHPDQPQLILKVLHLKDLSWLWHSKAPYNTKINLTVELLIRTSERLSMLQRIRWRIGAGGELNIWRVLMPNQTQDASVKRADLSTNGGIRNDMGAIQGVRASAVAYADEALRTQRPCRYWKSPVYEDFRKLVEQNQGKIVLFDMPQSSTFNRLYETQVGKQNHDSFQRHVSLMSTFILRPAFEYSDGDFPDLWHLRRSRSGEFTEALAQAYIEAASTNGNVFQSEGALPGSESDRDGQ